MFNCMVIQRLRRSPPSPSRPGPRSAGGASVGPAVRAPDGEQREQKNILTSFAPRGGVPSEKLICPFACLL